MLLQPISDKVIFKRFPKESQTHGGLELPDKLIKYSTKCQVVAVGPKVPDISPGDTILVHEVVGDKFFLNGEWLWIVKRNQVVGLLDAEEAGA